MSLNFDKPDAVSGEELHNEELIHALNQTTISTPPPHRNSDLGSGGVGREVTTSLNSLSLKVGRLDKRLDLIDDSVASISNEILEIKQDVKTVLDILLTNPPVSKIDSTAPKPITTDRYSSTPTVSTPTISKPAQPNAVAFGRGKNIVIDIGSNKPELVEIELDDAFEPVACDAFREYMSTRLATENPNGPQTESSIEMLVWSSTYTYINNFNVGPLKVAHNYGDSRFRYRPWSVAMWGKKAGETGPYDISQVLIAEESIFSIISEQKLSGDWIVFGKIVSGNDFCKAMIKKGLNKKGFIGFKQ